MWLGGLGIVPQTERLLVRFRVRAHAWTAGQGPQLGAQEKQPIDVSLADQCSSPFLLLSPSKKKKKGCLIILAHLLNDYHQCKVFFLKIIFLEREREGDREGETHQQVVPHMRPDPGTKLVTLCFAG